MKFAIYGAGAIGAFLGARLLESGHEVVFLARRAHLEAMRSKGLRIHSDQLGDKTYPVQATDDPAEVGPVDYVLLGVKGHVIPEIAALCEPLLADHTAVVSMQNGLPWWYFHGVDGEDGARIEAVDPGGAVERSLASRRAIGGIAYISCSVAEPGVVRHTEGLRFPLGEPDGTRTDRIKALSDALREGGIKAPIRGDIRHELWVKLLGNGIFNPLSALTRKTMIEMLDFPETQALIRAAMHETRETASAVGVQLSFSVEQRLEGARSAGRHKTSMLQDLEAGRKPELEPITGAILELAAKRNVAAPHLQAVYAAAKLLFA
ncbi:MAG: 2-dehydropantoate 2-reductase [Acidobacteria bacterium]|nr:2-dehydropantoate 2-reductase [Acidobacteriota bacterium]